ncbi:hypothetical protein [Paenibacillus eucommiae]|uniref:Flp pilus-assembly TadG-like N-terminal domain-containing protein n=1 Tax=Paenibacillus eucommiae TaxID=1355755 RepID=A0ABS4J5X2_9BACL|nr:hypothetical protein [Paenibacillus eucommiae]MBP1995244.1 hypothetical protein [Paenibacillus eucommiae]
MKYLWNSEDGAVSIYLILIIVPIFFFQAVLIDFARIKLAEKETESAVRAAVRSSLSAFDQKLQATGLYGLGISGEEGLNIFREVFRQNLSGSLISDRFQFVDTSPVEDHSRLTPIYTLASHEVLQRQILEDMKLKAPIEFALEITDKFKKSGASAPFKIGAQYAKEAEALEKLLEKREEALNQAWDRAKALQKKTNDAHSYYGKKIEELASMAEQIGVHSVEDIQSSLQNIKNQIQSIQTSIQALDGTLASLLAAVEKDVESIASIKASQQSLREESQVLLSKQSELEKVLAILLKYADLLMAVKLRAEADSSMIAAYKSDIEPLLLVAKQMNNEIRIELQRIVGGEQGNEEIFASFKGIHVWEDSFFDQYSASIGAIIALFNGFHGAVSTINLYTMANISRVNSANNAYFNSANDFFTKQGQKETDRVAKSNQSEAGKREQKNKIQTILDEARKAINSCSANSETYYQKLQNSQKSGEKGLYQKYRDINSQSAEIGSGVTYDLEKAEKVSIKAMDILGAFSGIAEGIRNELFVNEFALTKFNYRTYGLEKDIQGQPKTANELSDPKTHMLSNQEVEYILYGFSSCLANISSAYAEMFSFRLAIRTLEALMDTKKGVLNVGSPLLVLLTAAAEGAVKALYDMNELIKGNQVQLTAKLASPAISLTYKDYLRIFLLLHSNDTKQMARMQALIELNTHVNLLDASTYVQGYATSDIRLWFIPGIMKLLNGTELLGCKVKGKRCEITRTTAISY